MYRFYYLVDKKNMEEKTLKVSEGSICSSLLVRENYIHYYEIGSSMVRALINNIRDVCSNHTLFLFVRFMLCSRFYILRKEELIMSKFNLTTIKGLFKTAERLGRKHSPEILTGLGVAGFITTVVLTVKATLKIEEILEEEKQKKVEELSKKVETPDEKYKIEQETKLTKAEIAKAVWKPVLPVAITGLASVGCVIGGISVSMRRTAAFAAAYKISQEALETYKEETAKAVGEEKANEITKKANEKAVNSNLNDGVEDTGLGDVTIYDSVVGKKFKSTWNRVEAAVNELNRQMLEDDYVTLNDFYNILGVDAVGIGYQIGWTIDAGLLSVKPTSGIDDNDRPFLVLNYCIEPTKID